ncbi:MAG: type II toxin-antitoxin system RelE/ParE family toxin [Caldilineaceae bacterium SB0662_bin_9]|uniref:Type II toxin-antitoxin system RelE/ParE family toxin n=1 Tax=Caldilineaceae bacterium SB0662_bin_9 TaxID=2605258 RepID=A0A6B1DXV7_9CHLR|nr:type II toxin-antitoxin system RelE/ParE family toxin [Caldilineaceae bacterium SB0662_bin_9]
MSYSVWVKSAAKEPARLPRDVRERLIEAIDKLGEEPLTGVLLKGGLRGLRRLRVGDYRIVYEVLDGELIVLVVRVAHRRRAYR